MTLIFHKDSQKKNKKIHRKINFLIDEEEKFWYIILRTGSGAIGSAPVLGTGGCRFKSCLPDHVRAAVAQLVEH